MDPGFVGLCWRGAFMGELFTMFRNWLALAGEGRGNGSSRISKAPDVRVKIQKAKGMGKRGCWFSWLCLLPVLCLPTYSSC